MRLDCVNLGRSFWFLQTLIFKWLVAAEHTYWRQTLSCKDGLSWPCLVLSYCTCQALSSKVRMCVSKVLRCQGVTLKGGHVWLWVLRMPLFSPKRDTMQNNATSPSLTCLLDRYPLWIGYNRITQIGLHTMFMRFACTAQNRRKPCKTIMEPRVWWPLYGHCHLTWRSQDWEYCCLPPPSATEGQLALSVQVDLASSSRIYLMFDEAPSVWRKIERCHFPCMSLRVVFFFSLFLSPLCFICCSWFSVTRKFYLFGTT